MNPSDHGGVKAELDDPISRYSFETCGLPEYRALPVLFIERSALSRNVSATCEISSIDDFVELREALFRCEA